MMEKKKLQHDIKGVFYLLNCAEHFGDEKPNGLFFFSFFFSSLWEQLLLFLNFHAGSIFLQECSIICGVSVECPE